MLKEKFTENEVYSQFFSFEVLDYFDSITIDENYEWIKKYFDILMNNENINAEKFNTHHIRPCCTFKDKEHKNRKQTLSLANEFNKNLIKLSIYNHFFAHFYLWKIFNDKDSKIAFQRMCGQGKYIDNLTEYELKDVARLKEECAKTNRTKEESLKIKKLWNEKNPNYYKNYNNKNHDKIVEQRKETYLLNRNKILKQQSEYYKNNTEIILKRNHDYYERNQEKILEQKRNYIKINHEKILEYKADYRKKNHNKITEFNAQICYDPIKNDYPKFGALQSRKERNKELYKEINLRDYILSEEELIKLGLA